MRLWGNAQLHEEPQSYTERMSIAMLIQTKLRRHQHRMIDAIYLAENDEYAQHVMNVIEQTHDAELHYLATRLKEWVEQSRQQKQAEHVAFAEQMEQYLPSSEPTAEDIFREQVAHRYIGSLR